MRQPSGDLVPLRRSSPPKVAKPATPSKIDGRITLPADPAGLSQLLNQLPAIVADLVATATPHELERARNKAESLRYAVKPAKLGIEAQQTAAEARILLDHRLGALLADGLSLGRPKKLRSVDDFTLDDIGITPNRSSQVQRITAVPIHEVERYFGIARQSGWEITTTGNTGLLAWWADDIARQSGDGHQFYSGADRTRFDNHRHRGVIREHEREDDYRLLPPRLCGVRPPGQIRLPEDPVLIHPPTLDLYLGDCLERMAEVLDHSADLTLVDVPYGGSSHRWNRPLDLAALWRE